MSPAGEKHQFKAARTSATRYPYRLSHAVVGVVVHSRAPAFRNESQGSACRGLIRDASGLRASFAAAYARIVSGSRNRVSSPVTSAAMSDFETRSATASRTDAAVRSPHAATSLAASSGKLPAKTERR